MALARIDGAPNVALSPDIVERQHLVAGDKQIADFLILLIVYLLDRQLSLEHENWKDIVYERIDLIKPDVRQQMIEDLRSRTGLPVHRVEIIKIDFLRDIARLRAFYYSMENETSSLGTGDNDD